MVNRKMLYFHWMPSQVHQTMYTAGDVDINHVIQMIKNVFPLLDLELFFYYILPRSFHCTNR
jgi:Holliday junction resolvasome RuvABC endonuclease subunit